MNERSSNIKLVLVLENKFRDFDLRLRGLIVKLNRLGYIIPYPRVVVLSDGASAVYLNWHLRLAPNLYSQIFDIAKQEGLKIQDYIHLDKPARVNDILRARLLEPYFIEDFGHMKESWASRWSNEIMGRVHARLIYLPKDKVAEFELHMRRRLILARYRYELPGNRRLGDGKEPFDRIQSGIERIRLYLEDANQEHLVDAANMLLIECVNPQFSEAHVRSITLTGHVGKCMHRVQSYLRDMVNSHLVVAISYLITEYVLPSAHQVVHFSSTDDGIHAGSMKL